MMQKLPIWFGYAGLLPFLAGTALTLLADTPEVAAMLSLALLIYATMIMSFLGGVHWGIGLLSGNLRLILFAMVPTLAGIAVCVLNFLVGPGSALALAASIFVLIDWADRTLLPRAQLAPDYLAFRRTLNVAVVVLLLLAAWALWPHPGLWANTMARY